MSKLFKSIFGLSRQDSGGIPRSPSADPSRVQLGGEGSRAAVSRESTTSVLGFDPAVFSCSFADASPLLTTNEEQENFLSQVVPFLSRMCPRQSEVTHINLVVSVSFFEDVAPERAAVGEFDRPLPPEMEDLEGGAGGDELPLEACREKFLELLAESCAALDGLSPQAKAQFVPAVCLIFCQLRSKLSLLCGQWTDVLTTSDDFVRSEDLCESSVFVAKACSVIVNFINRHDASKALVAASVDVGFLPRMPWASSAAVSFIGGSSSGSAGDGEGIGGGGERREAWQWSSAMAPMCAAPREDETTEQYHWSLFLMEQDAVEGALSLLQYTHRLSRILTMHRRRAEEDAAAADTAAESYEEVVTEGVEDVEDVVTETETDAATDAQNVQATASTAMKNLTRLSLVLQNEIMFAVNCCMCSCRSEGYLKYKYLASSVINAIMVDIGGEGPADRLTTALQLQLGLLCLRQHETAAAERSHVGGRSPPDHSSGDDGPLLDSLCGLVAWMARSYGGALPPPLADGDVVSVGVTSPGEVAVPASLGGAACTDGQDDQALWPWGDNTSTVHVNSSVSSSPRPGSGSSSNNSSSNISSNSSSSSNSSGIGSPPRPFWIPVRKFHLLDTAPSPTGNAVLEWARLLDSTLTSDIPPGSSPRPPPPPSGDRDRDRDRAGLGTGQEAQAAAPLPWFVTGDSGRAWLMFFGLLYNNYFSLLPAREGPGGRQNAAGAAAGKQSNLLENVKAVLGAVLSSFDNGAAACRANSNGPSTNVGPGASQTAFWRGNAPLLQAHFLVFLGRCLRRAPELLIPAAREVDLWDALLCTDSFLLGGCGHVNSFFARHHVTSEEAAAAGQRGKVSVRCSPLAADLASSPPALLGYLWVYLHDAIFSLFNDVIQQCLAASSIVGYPRLEIIKFFEAFKVFGQCGADDLVLQGARWLGGLIEAGRGQKEAMSTVPEFLSVIISLNICGQQVILADSMSAAAAADGSSGEPDKRDIFSKLMAPIPGRPLLWHARCALIELILRVKVVSSHPKWLDVYLTSSLQTQQHLPRSPTRDADDDSLPGTSPLGSSPVRQSMGPPPEEGTPPSIDSSPSRPSILRMGSHSNVFAAGGHQRTHSSSGGGGSGGGGGGGASTKIPSVNTLRYLLADSRCLAAVAYIFGEICLRAASAIAAMEARKLTSQGAGAGQTHMDKNIPSQPTVISPNAPVVTVPGHISEQNKSWLAAMRPSIAYSSAHAPDEQHTHAPMGTHRQRSASSGDQTVLGQMNIGSGMIHSSSVMTGDGGAGDMGSNSLSPLLSAASKVTVSSQQLIHEILRVMLDQVRICGKFQSVADASVSSTRILVQLLRVFRDPSTPGAGTGTGAAAGGGAGSGAGAGSARRGHLQDLWGKRHMWSMLFGATMSYLKSVCNNARLEDASSIPGGSAVEGKMRFFHLSLSLMVSIMSGNEVCRDSFREFMVSSAKVTSRDVAGAGSSRRPSMSQQQQQQQGKEAAEARAADSPSKPGAGAGAAAFNPSSYDPIQRKPYRFNEFRLILSAALQPLHAARSYRVMETILILIELLFDGAVLHSSRILREALASPDACMGGLFPSNDDRPKIRNSLAVPILITLLPLLHVNDQICLLNSFHSLVRGRASLFNLTIFSQMNPSMLDLVLDVFPGMPDIVKDASIGLLQTLGRHSISVSQLKRVFRMIQSRGDFRPAYTAQLLTALKGMIAEGVQPRHSFVFEGVCSGLQLPCINKWPASKGYSFSIWMLVESPKQFHFQAAKKGTGPSTTSARQGQGQGTRAAGGAEYKPHVLSLRCRNGSGLDICLHSGSGKGKFKICLNSYGTGGECSTLTFPGLVVTEGKWHYFAVSHAAGGAFSSRGEVSVLLDDQFFRLKDSFPYPRFSDPIDIPLIGDTPKKYQNGEETALRGQLSAIYFFSDALSEGQLRGIRGLGPSYVYSFEPHNIVHRDMSSALQASKKQTVDPVLSVLDGSLTPLIMLAYNPAVWANDYILDNTPDKNVVKWGGSTTSIIPDIGPNDNPSPSQAQGRRRSATSTSEEGSVSDRFQVLPVAGKMHALQRLPGTYRNTTQDAKMALDSLGGIKVLLPLFAQFDQPRLAAVGQSCGGGSCIPSLSGIRPVQEGDASLDTQLSQVVLELLLILLDGHNSRLMMKIDGFALVSYLLERVSPQHLTVEVVALLWRLRERLFWNPAMQDHLLEHLLSNFKVRYRYRYVYLYMVLNI
jgi:hypothetical protein